MIPVISIIGKSNNGKTTLIEKIIPELKSRGYKVGAIKHDAHKFEIDYEGKDSYRMKKAGADTVVIASSEKIAMIRTANDKQQPANLDELVNWLFPDVDIVIAEGYKSQNKPKIEVLREGELICAKGALLAIVLNKPHTVNLKSISAVFDAPCFKMNDTKGIVDFIEGKFLKNGEGGDIFTK